LERATRCLKEHGSSDDNLLEDLSPLGWEHINLTGDYVWLRTRMPLNTSNSFCLFRKPSVKIEDVASVLVGPRPFSEKLSASSHEWRREFNLLFRFHILIRHDLAVSNLTAGVNGSRAKVGVPRGTEGIVF